jgi:hypothetical protein
MAYFFSMVTNGLDVELPSIGNALIFHRAGPHFKAGAGLKTMLTRT